jgi:pilus assembly protein CpaB
MRKRRVSYLFIIALVLGTGAAWLANSWILNRTVSVAEANADVVPVVVAALEIPFGKKIEGAQIKTVTMPRGFLPDGTFSNVEEVQGMIASHAIFPGEIVVKGKVAEHMGGSTLAAVVNPEMRAVTVRVNDVIGVAGFLLPGNRVDVLTSRVENRRAITRTLLQYIKVLAVDQTAATDQDDPVIVRAVTLEMTPGQAEELVKAREEGTIQLTLRNPIDETRLAEKKETKVVQKKSATPPSVTIIRGTQVSYSKVRL